MKRLFIILFLAIGSLLSQAGAQELRCTVSVNHDQVPSANVQNFNSLQQLVTEFLNTTKWTNLTFAEQERIECSLLITCKSVSESNLYLCEATLQSHRPIYNTGYQSPLINLKDNNFNFIWNGEPLYFQMNQFQSNLASMLAFYAYLLLGYDADSYQRLGGTPYFQVCENIVTQGQTASMDAQEQTGWQAFESKPNRYLLTNNLMDEAFKPLRQFYYDYHRLGMDEMSANVDNSRARIAGAIPCLREARRARFTAYVVNLFLDAKADELVNIFSKGTEQEKDDIYQLLTEVDPTRSNQYDHIKD
ncbi:MAG: DUF4835 family protein [Bacteroidales bacterium]|nr:DUF4835 family protein [Candidatus Colicola faecequi]